MKDFVEIGKIIDNAIEGILYPESPKLLYDPIEYIMGLKGKRMRPILVLIAHQLFDKNIEKALPPAIAIELSLIHI